ncbi:nucleotidyltransferase [Dysgonomonas sp. GY617]|uniref:nucleotidyltransferase n=1 Tax=Dysgonomonas sp. GY617 TaxID=2780420 RepID=UPI0018845223|nr:nucleotidyltransferase [Dysgonomonas sp. GY617]MBF0576592.1 nucleotidyltransferase [Dysgonomonas sp. GY617]
MTIAEIKAIMTGSYIADETIRQKYNLQDGKSFEDQFSTVSPENIIFYVVATCMILPFQVFEQFMIDLLALLRNNKTHTPRWYATRAKEFQFGYELAGDTDQYDNDGLTPEQIEVSQIVKFAAGVEADDQSILFVKVARSVNGEKQPLTDVQYAAFYAYIMRIKDAGVRITIVNTQGDDLKLNFDIYYDPLILDSEGKRLDGTNDTPIQDAIRGYISNLSFNGLYTNQALIDALQVVQGVEIADLKQAASRHGNYTEFTPIVARSVPYAGYYKITDNNLVLNMIPNE